MEQEHQKGGETGRRRGASTKNKGEEARDSTRSEGSEGWGVDRKLGVGSRQDGSVPLSQKDCGDLGRETLREYRMAGYW